MTKWAECTGIDIDQIHGCDGETDTSLSTLFLLNLFVNGMDRLHFWFNRWIQVNDYCRPWFDEMREVYEVNDRNFLATLDLLSHTMDLDPVAEFSRVGKKYPSFLTGVGKSPPH